jgi:transcriptional regulator with XRE-family HTH domain
MAKVTDIKSVVAVNLVKYRKEAKLTQTQAAEKLNYSDKAISKWERGESLPDVYVLKQIAEIYGVELDDMLHEETTKEKIQSFYRNRAVISILSVLLVWLVAMIAYVVLAIVLPNDIDFHLWNIFIYAIPLSFIVALVFNNLWGGRIYNMIIVSGLEWGVGVSLVFSLNALTSKAWYIYFICALFQVMVIIWYLLDIGGRADKARQVKAAKKEEEKTELAEAEDEKDEKEKAPEVQKAAEAPKAQPNAKSIEPVQKPKAK